MLASRLRSVATSTGGGNLLLLVIAAAVIGGTSLFGGVGRVASALYGALVIASIQNGLDLLGLASGTKFVDHRARAARGGARRRVRRNAAAPPAASAEAASDEHARLGSAAS